MLVYRHSQGNKIKIFPTRFEFTLPAQDIVGLWLRDLRRELFRRRVIICAFNPFHFIGK
jgi:hypothetical protein